MAVDVVEVCTANYHYPTTDLRMYQKHIYLHSVMQHEVPKMEVFG